MPDDVPQFGVEPTGEYQVIPSAYAVVLNDKGLLLVLKAGSGFHLPGGGIDSGEDAEEAVAREAQEEAGCEIGGLEYLGKANQFFPNSSVGPLNKLGAFYRARMISVDHSSRADLDHEVNWLTPDEFLSASAGDFQKWAVKKALNP